MTNIICSECETVAHCMKNGCVPKQPAYRAVKTYHDGKPVYVAEQSIIKSYLEKDNSAQQEPFCWCIESVDSADWCFAATKKGVIINSLLMDEQCVKSEPFALYTAPPAQRKPLTADEIQECWYKTQGDAELFARAIEAAHSIKENT